jgi:hypothetical protein
MHQTWWITWDAFDCSKNQHRCITGGAATAYHSLFAKVPVEDMLLLHSGHFSKQALALIRHVLTTPYFLYDSFCD